MIAISYRREDSLPIAGRLYDRLQAKFGKHNVFMDFDSIPPGVDFREQIKQVIERSKLVIAMIGPNWLGERSDASRRIDDPMDFVRLEIAYALKRGIPVIPVLINNAPMPKPEKLPPDIEGLAFRNAVTLDTGIDFHHHADRLITGICRLADVALEQRDLVTDSERTGSMPDTSRQARIDSSRQRKIVILGAVILLAVVAASATWFIRERERDRAGNESKQSATPTVGSTAVIVSPRTQSSPSGMAIAEPKATATTTPTTEQSPVVATNARPWREQITEFVRRFVELNESPDVDAAASFYAPNADILEEGPKSLDSIRRDIQAYNERWPMRRSTVRGDIQLHEKVPNEEYTASFKQDYYVESLSRREWIKGSVSVDLRIIVKDGLPRIASLKQKVLNREKGDVKGPTHPTPSPSSKLSRSLFAGHWTGATGCRITNLNGEHTEYGNFPIELWIDGNNNVIRTKVDPQVARLTGVADLLGGTWLVTEPRTLAGTVNGGINIMKIGPTGIHASYNGEFYRQIVFTGVLYKDDENRARPEDTEGDY
jgi:cytoskeletal protein RodZ